MNTIDYLPTMDELHIGKSMIVLLQGDITKQNTDVIVNAANSNLAHGGGVARAIANAAGQRLEDESRSAPKIDTGQVYTTTAGNLSAKKVIHAVGPVYQGGKENEAELLSSCIENSLKELERLDLQSISFPAISTGIFGYPLREAAKIMISSAKQYLEIHDTKLEVRFVLFSDNDFQTFKELLSEESS